MNSNAWQVGVYDPQGQPVTDAVEANRIIDVLIGARYFRPLIDEVDAESGTWMLWLTRGSDIDAMLTTMLESVDDANLQAMTFREVNLGHLRVDSPADPVWSNPLVGTVTVPMPR